MNPNPPADRAASQSTSFSTIAPVPMYASMDSAKVLTARISAAFQNSHVNMKSPFLLNVINSLMCAFNALFNNDQLRFQFANVLLQRLVVKPDVINT